MAAVGGMSKIMEDHYKNQEKKQSNTLNTDESIVDYLKSKGKDSSYTNRQKLAKQYGISNYSGTGEQNTKLLGMIKNGSSASATPTTKTGVNAGNNNTAVNNKIELIKESAVPKGTVPEAVQTAKPTTQSTAPTFNYNVAAPTYKGSYNDQITQLYQNIMNTPSFSYDMNNDALYNQYKQAYTKQAENSMRDTMGNAAALTGGYGSSYAATAGQQAYDTQMGNLNNIVPELYDKAYGRYQNDISAKYNQLNAAQTMANTEYNQYMDSYNRWDAERNTAYNQYLNTLNQYNNDREFGYNQSRDLISDSQWQQNLDYNKSRDLVSDSQWNQQMDYQQQRDSVSDSQWQQTFNHNKSQDQITNTIAREKVAATTTEADKPKETYVKGGKDYNAAKSELSEKTYSMVTATDEFGKRKFNDLYVANWIVNMSENVDMAEEILQAYGLYDVWYKNTYGSKADAGVKSFGNAATNIVGLTF